MGKLLLWLPKIIPGLLGILRALIKLGKEICTLIIDILFPVIPSAHFQTIVLKVRDFFNWLDGMIGKISDFFLKIGV